MIDALIVMILIGFIFVFLLGLGAVTVGAVIGVIYFAEYLVAKNKERNRRK